MNAPHLPARQFGGWHNVGALTFVQFAASGFVYFAYSAIFPAMVEALDWNRGSASIAHSIALVIFGICYPLTGYLIHRVGAKRTFTIGLTVMLVGLLPIATIMTELWQWIILWGFVVGLGFSLTGPVVSQTILMAWFVKRRATTIGIVMTGGAVGGAVSQPVLAEIIRQTGNWQSGWVTAIGMTILALTALRFVINQPGEVSQFADNINAGDPNLATASPQKHGGIYRTTHDWKIREVFRTRAVYMLLLVSIGHLAALFFLLNHGILFLTDGGMNAVSAATVIGLTILGSGVARVPAGWLGDKYALRGLVFASALLMLLGLLGFWQLDGFFLSALSAMTLGAGYGALLVLNPIIIGNYFGEKAFPIVNASFAPVLLPFAGAAPVAGGYIYEATGSYNLAFTIIAAALVISVIGAFLLTPPAPPAPIPSQAA